LIKQATEVTETTEEKLKNKEKGESGEYGDENTPFPHFSTLVQATSPGTSAERDVERKNELATHPLPLW